MTARASTPQPGPPRCCCRNWTLAWRRGSKATWAPTCGSSLPAAAAWPAWAASRAARLPVDAQADRREALADFRLQRAGSLRSWASMAAHTGLRMLELMFAGRLRGSVFRHMREDAAGRLMVDDRVVAGECAVCRRLAGVGRGGMADPGPIRALARALANTVV